MRSQIAARIVLGAAALLCVAPASAQQWAQCDGPNVSVISDAGQGNARDLTLRFEKMRAAFGQIFHRQHVYSSLPVRIIAVRDVASLAISKPLAAAQPLKDRSTWIHGDTREYLLFENGGPEDWQAAMRNYAQILLAANYPRTQPWFDEGFAQYFSAIAFDKQDIIFGQPPVSWSAGSSWIPVAELFSIQHASQIAAPARADFAAESWLIVQWLLSNSRLGQAGNYFDLVMNQNVAVNDAIVRAFGEDASDLDHDLQAYRAQAATKTLRYPASFDSDPVSFATKKLPDNIMRIILDDVALLYPDQEPAAMTELGEIMQQTPDIPEVQRALASGYIRRDDLDNAIEHIRDAIKLQDTDPRMQYYMAVWVNGGNENSVELESPEARLGPALNSALRMDPDFAPAYELLGLAQLSANKTTEAVQNLGRAAGLCPRNERYLLHLAEGQLANGDTTLAHALLATLARSSDPNIVAEAAKAMNTVRREGRQIADWKSQGLMNSDPTAPQWRPTPEQKKAMQREEQEMGDRLGKPDTRKTQYMRGTLVSVDCSQSPAATIRIKGDGKLWEFRTPDRSKMLLIGVDSFDCGWKNRRALVNFKASGPNSGDLLSLEID